MFRQNHKQGGFLQGLYEPNAEFPTAVNWTRQSSYNGPKKLNVKWKLELPDTLVHSQPIVGRNGEIYFGSASGVLYCVSSNGEIIWTAKLDGCIETPVMGKGGVLYVGTRNNSMFAIDNEGCVIWKYSLGGAASFSPAIDPEGNVYIASDNTLHAITSQGERLWSYRSNGVFWSSASLGMDGKIYVGANGNFLALNNKGHEKWKITLGASFASAPIISSSGIIFVEGFIQGGKRLLALDCNSGRITWSVKPEKGGIATSPALDENGVLYTSSNSFEVLAITIDGKIKWQQSIDGFAYYPPLVSSDGNIYVSTSKDISGRMNSGVFSLSNKGEIISSLDHIKGTTTGLALGKNGTLYALSGFTDRNELNLYALGDN